MSDAADPGTSALIVAVLIETLFVALGFLLTFRTRWVLRLKGRFNRSLSGKADVPDGSESWYQRNHNYPESSSFQLVWFRLFGTFVFFFALIILGMTLFNL